MLDGGHGGGHGDEDTTWWLVAQEWGGVLKQWRCSYWIWWAVDEHTHVGGWAGDGRWSV